MCKLCTLERVTRTLAYVAKRSRHLYMNTPLEECIKVLLLLATEHDRIHVWSFGVRHSSKRRYETSLRCTILIRVLTSFSAPKHQVAGLRKTRIEKKLHSPSYLTPTSTSRATRSLCAPISDHRLTWTFTYILIRSSRAWSCLTTFVWLLGSWGRASKRVLAGPGWWLTFMLCIGLCLMCRKLFR